MVVNYASCNLESNFDAFLTMNSIWIVILPYFQEWLYSQISFQSWVACLHILPNKTQVAQHDSEWKKFSLAALGAANAFWTRISLVALVATWRLWLVADLKFEKHFQTRHFPFPPKREKQRCTTFATCWHFVVQFCCPPCGNTCRIAVGHSNPPAFMHKRLKRKSHSKCILHTFLYHIYVYIYIYLIM